MNAYFKKHVNLKMRLYEFVRSFDLALARLRYTEAKANAVTINSSPVLSTHLKDIEKHAVDSLTRNMFFIVREEMKKEAVLLSKIEHEFGSTKMYSGCVWVCSETSAFTKIPEYANIYKEEEEERSDRWKDVLDRQSETTRLPTTDLSATNIKAEDSSKNVISEKYKEEQKWTEIRPSLRFIEDWMSSRVKNEVSLISREEACKGDSEEEFHDLDITESEEERTSPDCISDGFRGTQCLVQGGVPMTLRGEMWQAFVGVRARRIEKYYNNLLDPSISVEVKKNGLEEKNLDANLESVGVPEKWKSQIEKDLPRTFPGHPALDKGGRNALRRLLTAYARHNPSVDYCQFCAGPALVTTKDAGDAVTLLQSLAGSTFDSSQLVLKACMGFQNIHEKRLRELRSKHRLAVFAALEERPKGLKHLDMRLNGDPAKDLHEQGRGARNSINGDDNGFRLGNWSMRSLNFDKQLLCKHEQENAMLMMLMRAEQEQKATEDAPLSDEQDAAAQKYAAQVKCEKENAALIEMENRAVMAESMLEATLQYQSVQYKTLHSPRVSICKRICANVQRQMV
ncbi:TBC domain containing protein [Striga asiatica]|uniref:TBC domain containing protein n=1 Tax=Striga asiatica TaxID=4170 RepID=A0A5A7QWU9_STRAF|nr:TBC domain containing protein [Striga asiatica]